MRSQIFTGTVSHGRHWPCEHRFSYPVCFYRFDLDELSQLDKELSGFGYNRFSVIRMDDKDYLWPGNESLKEKVGFVLDKIGCQESIARIELISFARYFNIIFRPVSFFVCYDSVGICKLVLAEVHNTFKETHLYVLRNPSQNSQSLCFEIPKAFHVSPFFDRKGCYEIHFKDTGDEVSITILLKKAECGDSPVFFARLSGQGKPLAAEALRSTLLKYPFNAFLNMPRIIRQAITLYIRKKLPVFARPVADSEYSMRKKPPSWLARKGMKAFIRFLETQSVGRVKLTLPDGDISLLGDIQSGEVLDMQVKDYRFFGLLARSGEIGFGIAYEKGYWCSGNLVGFMEFMLRSMLASPAVMPWFSRLVKMFYLFSYHRHSNSQVQARKNISEHYDLSNAMYQTFLDETMTYSSAIFERYDESLEEAQIRKIDLMLEKAKLGKEHHLLEIGTGWGALVIRAASKYGCRVTSITLSQEQQELARERIAEAGLSDRIEVLLCDYRKMSGKFDRIVSVEMIEAVGKAYYPVFFKSCEELLNPNGIMVIQTITIPDQRYEAYSKTTDWMRLFIFPGGLLPSLTKLANVLTGHTSLVIKDVQSIGPHYALTLARWRECFLGNSDKIKAMGFSDSFIRRWDYYFAYCQAGFARHYIDDLQIVITRPGNPESVEIFEKEMGLVNESEG